ncbi:MAG: hypothetical protein ACRD2J_14595 [Thermoanaerobaculia bacterium]
MKRRILPLALAAVALAACSTSRGVDLDEPRRVVGSESGVRLDAQIFSERVGTGSSVRLVWEVSNDRPDAIAIADLVPVVSYERAENTIVVHLGSEVPGNDFVPRLVRIAPGEKKVFEQAAKISLHMPPRTPFGGYPRFLQIRLSFLGETEPFESLIGISENAIRDAELADQLFTQWVEANDTIRTNAIPIEWIGADRPIEGDASRRRF